MRPHPFGLLVLGVILTVIPAQSASEALADLTGPQILERCRRAYDALLTYQGTTHVITTSTLNGRKAVYDTAAQVQFVRPDKIRVVGTQISSGTFAFVSDGRSIWTNWNVNRRPWKRVHTMEVVFSGFSGASHSAATAIPAILLKVRAWSLFEHTKGASPKVMRENVNGRPAYRVEVTHPLREATYWVDRETFLLVKARRRWDAAKIRRRMPRGALAGLDSFTSGFMERVQTFNNAKINEKIAPGVFARPAGAGAERGQEKSKDEF